jgi:hypothetical protein
LTVKVTYTPKSNGYLKLEDETISSNAVVDVNDGTITFDVSGSSTGGQVKVTAIEVVYKAA